MMLDIKFVRSNIDKVMEMLDQRGYDLDLSGFKALDEKRRSILTNHSLYEKEWRRYENFHFRYEGSFKKNQGYRSGYPGR